MKKIFFIFAMMLTSAANAALIEFGPVSASGSGPLIELNNLVTPTTITGDATITINVLGDFNSRSEYADLELDGFSLGRILDNNTGNDLFDFANDRGNQSRSTVTGTATISESIFAGLISDGFLNFAFDASRNVNCCGTVRSLSGSISFQEVAAVPEPSTLFLVSMGLLGIAASRKKAAK